MRRLFSAAAAVAMLVAIHPSPAAALVVRPNDQISFSVAVTGTPNPYTLYLKARDVGPGSNDYLDVWFGRTATTGNHPQQTHYFYVTGATVSCGSGLGSCEINSGAQMGSLGQIHLYFTATSQAATIHHACPTEFGNPYNETRRNGQVTGTFLLKTGTSYFKTIRNTSSSAVHIPSSIATRASKLTYGTTNCTSNAPCTSQVFAGVSTPAGAISAYQFTSSGLGSIELDVSDPPVASTQIRHSIFDQAHVTVLHVTSNTPPLQKITLSLPFQPFVTGSGTFTGSGNATVSNYPGCRETDRDGTFAVNFTAHFDGWGAKSFNGSQSADAQHFVAQP